MSQETIDEVIARFQHDRQMIAERQAERNRLFQLSAENYQRTLRKEIETILHAEYDQKKQQKGNDEFRSQIQSLYLRYETGTERLRTAMQRTLAEKINYNAYLIKVYPKEYTEQKALLQEENENLKRKIEEIKRANNAFDYRLQDAFNQRQEPGIDQHKQRIDQLQEEQGNSLDPEDLYQGHPEYQPFNYNGLHDQSEHQSDNVFDQDPSPQRLPSQIPANRAPPQHRHDPEPMDPYLPPPSNNTDKLDRFLMPAVPHAHPK